MQDQSSPPPFRFSILLFSVVSWLQIPAVVFLVVLLRRGVEPTNVWAWLLGAYLVLSVIVQAWLRPSVSTYGLRYVQELNNPEENQEEIARIQLAGLLEMSGLACICFGWATNNRQFMKAGFILLVCGVCILLWRAHQERRTKVSN